MLLRATPDREARAAAVRAAMAEIVDAAYRVAARDAAEAAALTSAARDVSDYALATAAHSARAKARASAVAAASAARNAYGDRRDTAAVAAPVALPEFAQAFTPRSAGPPPLPVFLVGPAFNTVPFVHDDESVMPDLAVLAVHESRTWVRPSCRL